MILSPPLVRPSSCAYSTDKMQATNHSKSYSDTSSATIHTAAKQIASLSFTHLYYCKEHN